MTCQENGGKVNKKSQRDREGERDRELEQSALFDDF